MPPRLSSVHFRQNYSTIKFLLGWIIFLLTTELGVIEKTHTHSHNVSFSFISSGAAGRKWMDAHSLTFTRRSAAEVEAAAAAQIKKWKTLSSLLCVSLEIIQAWPELIYLTIGSCGGRRPWKSNEPHRSASEIMQQFPHLIRKRVGFNAFWAALSSWEKTNFVIILTNVFYIILMCIICVTKKCNHSLFIIRYNRIIAFFFHFKGLTGFLGGQELHIL